MLVQSNSGGGKSWALRRLLEQTAPAAQQIIIDVEGEFTTLREKFDYVICEPKPSRKVPERLEKIQSLPRRKQDAILTTIDHFLNSAATS